MLAETDLLNYLQQLQNSGTKMSLKDGVLASEADGRWYVMVRGVLNKQGTALASKSNAVVQIHNVCDSLEEGETMVEYKPPYYGVNKYLATIIQETHDGLQLFPEFRSEDFWMRRKKLWLEG